MIYSTGTVHCHIGLRAIVPGYTKVQIERESEEGRGGAEKGQRRAENVTSLDSNSVMFATRSRYKAWCRGTSEIAASHTGQASWRLLSYSLPQNGVTMPCSHIVKRGTAATMHTTAAPLFITRAVASWPREMGRAGNAWRNVRWMSSSSSKAGDTTPASPTSPTSPLSTACMAIINARRSVNQFQPRLPLDFEEV